MPSLIAVTGSKATGKTGGEQYNARLLQAAEDAGFRVSYLTFQDSWLDKLMGLSLLWRLRFVTRSIQLSYHLWRSSGVVWLDIWFAPYAKWWARHTSRPILLMVHHLRGDLEQDARVKRAEAALIRAATRILTVSQSSKRQIEAYLDTATPIDIIPPGFARPNTKRPNTPPAPKQALGAVQLLFVGHITQVKGVLDLLQAVARLQAKDWVLHVVGGASAEPETWKQAQAIIAQHGLRKQVIMHGRVEDAELQALYQQADIFVLPSYWEGYGIVFLEAMSMGLPVVSTTAGAIPEVVEDGKAGLLVEAGDTDALCQALQRLIASPSLRQGMGQAALQAAQAAPDWQQVEQQFVAWWRKRAQDV